MFLESNKNRRPGGQTFYILAALLMVIGGAALGIQMGNDGVQPAPSSTPIPTIILPGDDDQNGNEVIAPSEVLNPGSIVTVTYIHKACGHSYDLSLDSKETEGLTKSELMLKYPKMQVISFSGDGAKLSCEYDCYCPQHYTVTLIGDELVITRTQQGTENQMVVQRVPVDPTAPGIEDYSQGIVYNSLDEVESILQNFGK